MQYGHGKYMLIRHTHSLSSVGEKRIASKKCEYMTKSIRKCDLIINIFLTE